MIKNSNQTGALLLLAIVLGAAVYALMFFGSNMEQTNMSASFGPLSKSKSVNLLSNNKESAVSEFKTKEIRSDLLGVSLPIHKMKSTSGGDYAQTSNPDFPSTGIEQADVQNMNGYSSARTNFSGNYARNESQSFAIGNSSVEYISNPQNPTKLDINALLLLDTHAAETAMSSQSQQGSKRATAALAAKTSSVSTSLTDSKTAKKITGDPGDPGASLSIGDGVWILLLMGSGYSFAACKRSKNNDELIELIG
ncbi:MAG: hypothetical protein WCJ61_06450 [Paludibacter sp.]